MIMNSVVSTLTNLVILVGLPFLVYFLFHKLRKKREFGEIARRAGLCGCESRYLLYCAAVSAVVVVALVIWPPPLELFTRDGSPQQKFIGLGFSGPAVTMALLYGVVATGFSEEFLFRGLIAGSLSRRLSVRWANFWQALIFFLPHLLVLLIMPEMWWHLGIVFVFAPFIGWVRIKSGSILGPWMVHATGNMATCLSVAIRSAA